MARCGICGADRTTSLFHASDRNFKTTDERFLIEQCSACGVAQTIPRPSSAQSDRYYPPPYYPTSQAERGAFESRLLRLQREKVSFVANHTTAGALLDVGCGVGAFVRAASLAGFQAQGIELSAQAVEFGRRAWGITLRQEDVLGAQYPAESFDVVTLWQVLEHLAQPIATLQKIHRLLKSGGLLILAVPNFASIQARVFRSRWYHLEVPRHLFHYTPASLKSIVQGQGFRVLQLHYQSREHNWAGILGSIVHLDRLSATLPGRVFRELAGKPVSAALASVESLVKRGGTFTLCAEKQAP